VSVEVVKKLRIAGGQRVLVLNADEAQKSLLSDLPGDPRMVDAGDADAVVLFARDSRDRVRELTAATGVEAVSQIALDSTWSALRFRPVR
jgi:hypothetical protein